MGAAQIYSHKFRTPGTYDYLCVFHQGMRGTVVVK
jgi:plastocyanin